MIRIAYFFALVAVATVFPLALDLSGRSAILFVFIGFPALAVAIPLFVIDRWRAGAFRLEKIDHQG